MLTNQNFACDNEKNNYVRLESKVYKKYLGVLIDQNLSWFIVTKVSLIFPHTIHDCLRLESSMLKVLD